MKRICQRVLGFFALCLLFPWLPLCLPAGCQTNQPTQAELQPLQGTWEGIVVGEKADSKIAVTITGSSFHSHRDTNFWFETTIMLIKPWQGKSGFQGARENPLFGAESTVVAPAERIIPPGSSNPQELHVTIKDGAASQRDAIGKTVVAIFKIEDGLLTIAAGGDGAEGAPASFEDEKVTRYELRKIPSGAKKIELPKSK